MSFPDNHLLDKILFFAEDVDFPSIDKLLISTWIQNTIKEENKAYDSINVIFCSDEFLLRINQEHLKHDYYTDIITFQYEEDPIEGELFISLDRVADNATKLETNMLAELRRVIIHGVLHMVGYKDKTEAEKNFIREKEDHYLNLLETLS